MRFLKFSSDSFDIAFIAETPIGPTPTGAGYAAFEKMSYVASADGQHALRILLSKALADESLRAVAISLNERCVLDDELPARIGSAFRSGSGEASWAVLAASGKSLRGAICSVVYPSAAPRLFTSRSPQPIIDCGIELFLINLDFLRTVKDDLVNLNIHQSHFAQWCIIKGYLEGHASIFRPELAIGVDGAEHERDLEQAMSAFEVAFGEALSDDFIPSVLGNIPLAKRPGSAEEGQSRETLKPRSAALARSMRSLADLIRDAIAPAVTPISLSIITRTKFTRQHLLRRLLSTVTRARQDLKIDLEVVLTTDVEISIARQAHQELQAEFVELSISLQINNSSYPHSRVDNLIGGIMAATKDYVVVIDDDDFVDIEALKVVSNARFLNTTPLLIMSSQVREETWRKTSNERWVLESSIHKIMYDSDNYRYMFTGINQLPVCAMITPREWTQNRLRDLVLRHDLSEDYIISLALLSSIDLPPILIYPDVFCVISVRPDGSNTVTMEDRKPWVRDITLFMHDIFIKHPISGAAGAQMLYHAAKIPEPDNVAKFLPTERMLRQGREIALLNAEIAHLRRLISEN